MTTEARTSNDSLDSDPLIGKIISERYRVLERIGRGGFGAVYKVQHIRLDKILALKVLFEHTNQNPRMIKRFEREARATCRIGHDNIVEITDFARDRRVGYYFVMEHLQGETLAERLRRLGPIPASRIVHIGCQIADALAATHSKGIVHRDLKPENIFLVRKRNEDSFVKILDFGIAAMGDLEEAMPRLTRHGQMLGTPAYMSPEQAEGKPPDHRSDIYSLGIILYEMTTGQVPYQNAASMAVLEMHRSREPDPPRQARPDLEIPPALERVVLRALRKQMAQRYQTMREVYNDLVNVSQQIDMSEMDQTTRRPEVRVDGPPTPQPEDIEPEEPEWLDEDLVLLEDDPGLPPTMAIQIPVALDMDPTRVDDRPPEHLRAAIQQASPNMTPIELDDDDLEEALESTTMLPAAAFTSSPVVAVVEEEEPELTTPMVRPGLTTTLPSESTVRTAPVAGTVPMSPREDMTLEQPRWSTTPPARPARRPPSSERKTVRPSVPAPPQRKPAAKKKSPAWQRPPVLMAAGFILTIGLYGLVLAFNQKPDAKPRPEADTADVPKAEEVDPEGLETAEKPATGTPAPAEATQQGDVVEETAPGEAIAPEPTITVVARASLGSQRRTRVDLETQMTPLIVARVAESVGTSKAARGIEVEPGVRVIELVTTPPGAEVVSGKTVIGTTPLVIYASKDAFSMGFADLASLAKIHPGVTGVVMSKQGKRKLSFKLKGYRTTTKQVDTTRDTTLSVKMKKRGSGGGGSGSGGGSGNSYEIY